MKLIFNGTHDFKGYGIHPSTCSVKIWEDEDSNYVLFEDMGMGTSVTNASEQIATEIKPYLTRSKVLFFETYPGDPMIDEITYQMDSGGEYYSPNWKRYGSRESFYENIINDK